MTILAAVSIKSLHLPKIRIPKWPKLKLGQRLSDATQAYASAVSTTYLVALGQRTSTRRDLDY